MIPLCLTLENFMCYREKTVINFRGSTIWTISGHNGSGKSTLFDAMRYALYGEHRAGKQKIEALIHHNATFPSSFFIEFDFAIGENEYRVQRTYSQKKRGTVQILHLIGPDSPTPGRPSPQLIPGTETKEGFESWILKTVGLDEQAFTVSVLLLQGQSDKLLKLGGPEQHEVLTHIIDLSRYDTLAKSAAEKQKIQDISAKTYKGQLDGLEQIDEIDIDTLEQQAHEAQTKKEWARQHQLTLTRRKEFARSWQQLQEEEKHPRKELIRIEHVLVQSEHIEHNAARLTLLQQILQPLTQIQQKRVESSHLQHTIEQDQKQAIILEVTRKRVCKERQKVQLQLETTCACYQQQEQEQKGVQKDKLALQVPCNDIARLQEKQQTYQELLKDLALFAPDLEQQQYHLGEKLHEMSKIEAASPLLQRFAHFRSEWQQATQDLSDIVQKVSDQKRAQEQTTTQREALQETGETLREHTGQLQSEVKSQTALLTECRKRFDRFHSIEGGATCSYCGQPLTPEHLETERQQIKEELQKREHDLHLCTSRFNEAQQQQKTMEQEIKQAQQKEQQQQKEYEKLTHLQNDVARKRDTTYTEAKNLLEQLIPEYLGYIQGAANTFVQVDTCLHAIYPTPQDLDALSLQLRDKSALNQKWQAIEDALSQQQILLHKQHYILSEIEPLQQSYPPERAQALLQQWELTEQKALDLTKNLEKLSVERKQQEQQSLQLTEEEENTKKEQNRLEQALAIAMANLRNAQQAMIEIQEQIPTEGQVYIPHLSSEMLEKWQQEIRQLQGAREQYEALVQARQHQIQYSQTLRELENKQRKIPEEAQCTPEQVQEEIHQINTLYHELERQEQSNRTDVQRLQGIRKRRQELQQQWVEATRLASRYKELAHLLGREGLQHYLVQNAEVGIVYHANEMLDRISGGTLRLELRPSSEKKAKTLDMVAYNSAINAQEPQSIELLSGSQQFRVAVSLAIGIGQYMGNASHRVESIMIDEGFGSLDASSRDEMAQALQTLESDFKCVIVVSHQNEFFDKFPNRYEAEIVDGRTKITLV